MTAASEQPASERLRRLARRIVDETLKRVALRAALLAGSAGRGDADHYSDIDLLLYVDRIPSPDVVAGVRQAVGGVGRGPRVQPTEQFSTEEFDLSGVRVELSFTAVSWMDARLDDLLERFVDFD